LITKKTVSFSAFCSVGTVHCMVSGQRRTWQSLAGVGAVARGGCLFDWNFNVTWSAVFSEAETRARPNTTLR